MIQYVPSAISVDFTLNHLLMVRDVCDMFVVPAVPPVNFKSVRKELPGNLPENLVKGEEHSYSQDFSSDNCFSPLETTPQISACQAATGVCFFTKP